MDRWLEKLKREAQTGLGIYLQDSASQMDWPMMVRYFKLLEIEKRLDAGKLKREQGAFLTTIRPFFVQQPVETPVQ